MLISSAGLKSLIHKLIKEESIQDKESIQIEPTYNCVSSYFKNFQSLGKDEQTSYYNAFNTCVDRSFVNTDTLTVIHWFNLYEGSSIDLLFDFNNWATKNNMKFNGAISAVGYDNFQSKKSASMIGKIGFILDGPISLAFNRDAETERGGVFQTKMPGKLQGGISNNPEDYIQYMILGPSTYGMPSDTKTTNEFILINPGIKQIIIDIEWLKKDISRFGSDKEGNTIGGILKSLGDILLSLNIPITDLNGVDIKGEINNFASISSNKIDTIIQTLIGEKSMIGAGMYGPTTLDLFKNVTKLKVIPAFYPELNYWSGDRFKESMIMLHKKGKLKSLIGEKNKEPAMVNQNPYYERPYYGPGGETLMLSQSDFIRRYLEAKPLYYKKIQPFFKDKRSKHNGGWEMVKLYSPWVEKIDKFMYWVDMEDYGGYVARSPIEDTLIPFYGIMEYDNFSIDNLPVPPNVPSDPKKSWVAQIENSELFYLVEHLKPSVFNVFKKILSFCLIYSKE